MTFMVLRHHILKALCKERKKKSYTCFYTVLSLFSAFLLNVSKFLENLNSIFLMLQNICIPLLSKSYINFFRSLCFFVFLFRAISGIMCFHFLLYRAGRTEFSAIQESKIIKLVFENVSAFWSNGLKQTASHILIYLC